MGLSPSSAPLLQIGMASALTRRRITITPYSLVAETQATLGNFQPEQEVFWDEVRAVYVWDAPDWIILAGGAIIGLVLLCIAAVIAAESPNISLALLLPSALALVCFLWGGLGAWLRPRRWFRVDTTRGELRFHSRNPRVLGMLLGYAQSGAARP